MYRERERARDIYICRVERWEGAGRCGSLAPFPGPPVCSTIYHYRDSLSLINRISQRHLAAASFLPSFHTRRRFWPAQHGQTDTDIQLCTWMLPFRTSNECTSMTHHRRHHHQIITITTSSLSPLPLISYLKTSCIIILILFCSFPSFLSSMYRRRPWVSAVIFWCFNTTRLCASIVGSG
jgi:hypothetical protein